MRLTQSYEHSHFAEGCGVDPNETSTVNEDLWPNGALCHQLGAVLKLGIFLLQNLEWLHSHYIITVYKTISMTVVS